MLNSLFSLASLAALSRRRLRLGSQLINAIAC
jgi:hypothetical protein